MRRICQIGIFVLSIFLANIAAGATGKVTLIAKVDKNRIRIGDLIKYTILVTYDDSVKIEMPTLGANLGAFEIRDYEDVKPEKKDGVVTQKREYVISTFDVGDYEIPPVTVRYSLPGDTTWQALTTEKLKITVESMKPSEEGDIRDIKPPLEIPRDWWRLARWIGAGIVVLIILGLILYYIKRRRQGKPLLPRREKPKRPPHEIALEELEKLKKEQLLEKGEVKQFYSRISDIIRRYFENRFFIPALEMTTGQLMDVMGEAEIEPEVIEIAEKFLSLCDLVKFAKYIPVSEENESAMDFAFQIVEMTKIIIEPEAETAAEEQIEEPAEEGELEETPVEESEPSSGISEREEE
ncbi:MAG: protein BatD [Calditrichaeota bacterium]|nr:protein BatD [Calditrichota bacterium]